MLRRFSQELYFNERKQKIADNIVVKLFYVYIFFDESAYNLEVLSMLMLEYIFTSIRLFYTKKILK